MSFEQLKISTKMRKDMNVISEHIAFHSKGNRKAKISGPILEMLSYEVARLYKVKSLHHPFLENCEFSLRRWEALRASNRQSQNLEDVSKRFVAHKRHYEVFSHNYDNPLIHPVVVPGRVVGEKRQETFSEDHFVFRWWVLFRHFRGLSLSAALEILDVVRKSLVQEARAAPTPKTKEECGSVWLNSFLPTASISDLQKRQCRFNRLWALQMLHEDLVGLIYMDAETLKHPSPISNFVINELGSRLLYAKWQRKWSWDVKESWEDMFNGKIHGPLPDLGPKSHVVEINGERHAFRYIVELDPSLAKICILHDPQAAIRSEFNRSTAA